MIKYFIFHPIDKLHKLWINTFIEYLKINHFDYINTDDTNLNNLFFNEIKDLSINNQLENKFFLYICHPIELLNNESIKNIKIFMNSVKIKKILYITEPLNLLIYKKTYTNLIIKYQISELWTYSHGNLIYYKPIYNIPILKKGICYNKQIQFINNLNEKIINQKINNLNKIVFIGNVNKERKDIIDLFGDDIIIKNNVWDFNDFKELFENYTYFLNIHRNEKCICLENFRIIPILSNYGYVLSENINDLEQNNLINYNIKFDDKKNLLNLWNDIKKSNEVHTLNNILNIKNNCDNFRIDYLNKF